MLQSIPRRRWSRVTPTCSNFLSCHFRKSFPAPAIPPWGGRLGAAGTGDSHLRAGKPCDDAYAVWSGSLGAIPALAVAVADGHGDLRHDQSRFGAGIAVHAALEEAGCFFAGSTRINRGYLEICSDFKTAFARRVTRRWREMVEQDAERRGVGAGTLDPLKILFRYGTGQHLLSHLL